MHNGSLAGSWLHLAAARPGSSCPKTAKHSFQSSFAGDNCFFPTVRASTIIRLWAQIPNMAVVSYTSSIPQNCVYNC